MLLGRFQKVVTSMALVFALFPGLVPSSRASQERSASTRDQVLFIGNSYTAQTRNSLEQMLANSAQKGSRFEFVVKGGATLQQHLHDKTTRDLVTKGNWSFVVLQEQSQTPALPGEPAASFQSAVDAFASLIRSAGAEPVLFMTWGRLDGDKHNRHVFPDYTTMQQKLSKAYRDAAARNHLLLAPVGEAWSVVRNKDQTLGVELYRMDGSHPSQKGAFLASCVFFQILFNDPLDAVALPDSITREEWRTMREAILGLEISHPRLNVVGGTEPRLPRTVQP